jgi:hypothetical protein
MRCGRLVSLAGSAVGLPVLMTVACARGDFASGYDETTGTDVPMLADDAVTANCVTHLSGTVVAPNGRDPVYNAVVFIPSTPLEPIKSGATCERCDVVSGNPIAAAVSGPDGHFELEVPPGDGLTIAVQIGKWRRAVPLPKLERCKHNHADRQITRLPRSHREGDIPLHAVSTGNCDRLECVLRKMGIDDSEFTVPSAGGRIHLYRANGGTLPNMPSADALTEAPRNLKKYDLVLFDCTGSQDDKMAFAKQAVVDYAAAGGRVYASHFSYVWLYDTPPFSGTGDWSLGSNHAETDRIVAKIDTSSAAGAAFARWMTASGALSEGETSIEVIDPRYDLKSVRPPSQRWLYTDAPTSVQEYTFNTPVEAPAAEQCGKVSFSDFHVTGEGCVPEGLMFPDECGSASESLTPQEHVLEFMLLDLASCVQPFTPPAPAVK